MAAESSSSEHTTITQSSKVNFKCREGVIALNNAVALLEHPNTLFTPMLSFLSNCCISKALTIRPSAMYVEYLKEFWYSAEVDDTTKSVTFHLSWWNQPLTFSKKEFIEATGLPTVENPVPLPPKETVRAGLATLGLMDKEKPALTSTDLVHSSPLKMKYFSPTWKIFMQYIVKCLGGMQGSHDQMNINQQTIAYCLIFGLNIDIGDIIYSDLIGKLQNGKKTYREANICYTRYLSLVFENLLGANYSSSDLTLIKPHVITTASFQKPLASEVGLTAHMLQVAKLSEQPEQSLIPSSEKVNADVTSDKSLSKTSVQLDTQPKATTDKGTKKKSHPAFSQPKSSHNVRVILPNQPATHLQHAEEFVVTADTTKSIEVSKSAETQENQPSTAEAEKVTVY